MHHYSCIFTQLECARAGIVHEKVRHRLLYRWSVWSRTLCSLKVPCIFLLECWNSKCDRVEWLYRANFRRNSIWWPQDWIYSWEIFVKNMSWTTGPVCTLQVWNWIWWQSKGKRLSANTPLDICRAEFGTPHRKRSQSWIHSRWSWFS